MIVIVLRCHTGLTLYFLRFCFYRGLRRKTLYLRNEKKSFPMFEFILLNFSHSWEHLEAWKLWGFWFFRFGSPLVQKKKKTGPRNILICICILYTITQCFTDKIFIYDAPSVYLSQELASCRNLSQVEL